MTCDQFDAITKECVVEKKRVTTDAEVVGLMRHLAWCEACQDKVSAIYDANMKEDPEEVRRGVEHGQQILDEIERKQDPEL